MSAKTKRILKRLVSRIGIVFFMLAAGMLYWQLRKYELSELLGALTEIPSNNVVIALFICLAGYLVLAFYDFLALKYVGRKLSWWKWLLAGLLGFAISNNAGNAAISGGAIRYRLYTRWRIRAGEIVKMLTFSGMTYFLGAATVVVIGYALLPSNDFTTSTAMHVLFTGSAVFIGAYALSCLIFRKGKFKIGGLTFHVPGLRTAITQMSVGATDSILAGLVLFSLAKHTVPMGVVEFVSIFVIAQAAGIFAQVPGGIGVFESVIMLAVPDNVDKAMLFGSLLAFRIIYFLVPLMITGTLFLIYERNLYNKMKHWKIFERLPKRKK